MSTKTHTESIVLCVFVARAAAAAPTVELEMSVIPCVA